MKITINDNYCTWEYELDKEKSSVYSIQEIIDIVKKNTGMEENSQKLIWARRISERSIEVKTFKEYYEEKICRKANLYPNVIKTFDEFANDIVARAYSEWLMSKGTSLEEVLVDFLIDTASIGEGHAKEWAKYIFDYVGDKENEI